MKKKILVMILLVAMLPAMLFANDILQMGLNVGYKPSLDTLMNEPKDDWKDYFKGEYFTFAPEVKLNLFLIDLDATAQFNFSEQGTLIDTQVYADLYGKIVGLVKLGLGVGVNMPFLYDNAKGEWQIGKTPLTGTSFVDALKSSYLAYRAGIGFDFGRFNMMINYAIPTENSFAEMSSIKSIQKLVPDWDHGQFTVGLLIDLF